MTPNMLTMTDVKTPSHVPNKTGWEIKKFDFHHGLSPCIKIKLQFSWELPFHLTSHSNSRLKHKISDLFFGIQFIISDGLSSIAGFIKN